MLGCISYFFTMNLKKVQNFKRISAFLKECPNKLTFYPELKEDLKLLCSPEMKGNIKSDLQQILPGVLVLSTVTEESVVQEIVPLFGVISDIVSNNVSLKTEPWWREMENNIVPNKFFSGLTALIEGNSQFWAHIWVFAVSLMINDTQLQGSTVNSLLKIMEVAFKKSLTDTGSVMEKAFFCWIKFIEIFTSNPRILHSKKLIGLLIRPLTIPMGPKSHFKIIQTYKLIFEKVGTTEDKNIVTDIINSFIEYSYMKGGDSFSKTHPNECCEILLELICEKNCYRNMYILPVLSVFTHCVESRALQDLLLKLWHSILDSSDIVDPSDYEQYLEEIIVQRQKTLKNTEVLKDYEAFREQIINHELPLITLELLDKLLISNALSPKILADLLEYNDFRTKTLANYFNQFINNVNTEVERKETSCAAQMEAWDTFCAAFNLFVDSKGYQFQETDSHTFKPLILFPLQTHAKWTGITQRTWHSLIDLVEKIGILKLIIPDIISTLNLNMESNKVNTSTVIDIITHLVNIDKTVNFIPTVDKILAKLPVDDPKNAIDLLAFIENLIGHGDKKQYLSGVLSELLRVCTCFDQLHEHRIRTKVSKLHRKLITDSKAEIGDKNKESSRTPSPKIRSPLMTGSNFLHRLAKSEEKKASTSISLGLGDRNMKNTLKSNKDLASNKCKDSGDKVITKEKEKEKTMAIKEEITLPRTVNIVITNNTLNNVNNVPIIKTPEDNLKLSRKLQNGDCRLNSTTKKSANTKRTAISYFEDDSQEFVIVASKPKAKTPLTEHQKEKMLLRTSDIPALYQDLSQDTQSISSIIEKNTPEIAITSEDKKTLSYEGKNAENQDQVNRSLDVIEVTPPAQNLLITPTKSSPYMTASKKLNFDGLVKANSPAQGDMHTTLHETKNDLEENCMNTPSRRVSHRKTTSKYGVNRVITPTKDSNDISNENSASSSEDLNKKTFVKQERSGKKLKQEDDLITEKKKELSLLNEKYDIDFKKVEDLKCNLESTLTVSSSRIEDSLECNDKLRKKEKERSNAAKKPKLDINSSREKTSEKIDEKQDTVENSVKNEKLQENKENNCNEKSVVENSEAKKVEEKEDFKPTQSDKLIKSALVSGIVQAKIYLHKTSQGEPIKSTTVTNVKISSDIEGGKDDKSELSFSDRNAKHNNSNGSTTPSSQRTGRRPRKLPPTPFSPKLTRSKKLSLQGKDKSPKSPKDTKSKIRAPKPNTECFSSDSNDSLTGITPLEKNTGTVVEQVTVNNSLKCIQEAYPVKITNEEHLEKAVVNIVTEGKIHEESVSEEMKPTSPNPLEECNENSEPKKRGRKRKLQPSPEANDHNNSEIKIVNSFKKGKKRKTFGNNRANSHSPRLTSGLEHWLYKKDKDLTQNVDVNEESSVDKEDKSVNKDLMTSISSVIAFPPVVNSTSIKKTSSEDKSPTEISHEEQLVENVKSENDRPDKIESTKGDMQLMSIEECDTEIISTEELKANDSQNLELVSNEIIASSQDVEYSDDIFGSILKKVKLSLPGEMEAKCISTQLNKVSSDITSKGTLSDKSLECSKANDVSPTVTKVEKIANGMKACDLIFKVAELEEKITIYMEEPPITATRDVEMNQEENENQDAPAVSPEIPAQEVLASSQIEQRSLNNDAFNKKSGQNIMVSETCSERTENPQTNSLMATSVEAVQMINNCVDTFISAKNTENIKTIELHKKDIVITSDEDSPCKSNEKSCTMKDELLTVEIKQNNGNDEVIVDTEIAKSKSRDIDSPDKLKTENLSESLNNESQNDSEQIFKNDTPKKRGARFIHTTEKEEDGGDTAEDRRRRNFRSKGTNLDDKNSLGSSGRSKHMVQLAQQGRHSRINTPRRRPSIVPITYGSNWPTGPTEEWVGVRPSTPGHCLSPGILKSSPASSPGTSIVSPPPKKKRVNFLDPPVSTGLLYQKGTKIGIGQLQYAETSPSKKRLLNQEEEVGEKKMKIISDDEGKELEPAFEVEISSDESIEMLQVTDSEISENNALNEVDSTVSQSFAEKSDHRPEKSVDICENTSGSILENISKKSESISDNSNFPILAVTENVEITTEKPNENLEIDANGEIYSKIPTEDELKIYANNQQFLNNLASCLNANGEPLSWLQRLLTLIVVGSKK